MNKNFISSLFDFSFSDLITPKIISFIYIVGVIATLLMALIGIVVAFISDLVVGIIAIFLSPLYFFISIILLRLYLELIVVLFKIYQGIRILGNTGSNQSQPAPASAQQNGGSSRLNIDL